jgi:diaminopimelate epimerase
MPDSPLSFYKMQGAGNDFVVWDNRNAQWSLEQIVAVTPALCDRHFGVGSDGVLVLSPAQLDDVDYEMIFRNPDGSDAGMCGNGGRCIARFAHHLGFDPNHTFHVHENRYQAQVHEDSVALSFPMKPQLISHSPYRKLPLYEIHPGTEHIVVMVDQNLFMDHKQLLNMARDLRYDEELAPKGCNVNFAWPAEPGVLQLKTYERGVEDFTLACGTGAIATALAGFAHLESNPTIDQLHSLDVRPTGGRLSVDFTPHANNDGRIDHFSDIVLRGPARFVFEGTFDVAAILD